MFAAAALYLTLGFCALGIGLAVIRYDLYDREPWRLILFAVALGALGMWASYHAEISIISASHRRGRTVDYTTLAFIAGIIEEVSKAIGVAVMALLARRHFNDPLDGLVYGSFIGLGAAIEESVALLSRQDSLAALPATEPVRLVGHLIMGGIGGFGFGILTAKSRSACWAIPASLLAAIAMHIAWDVAAFAQLESGQAMTRSQTIIPVLLMLLGMLIYRKLAYVGAGMTRSLVQSRTPQPRRCP